MTKIAEDVRAKIEEPKATSLAGAQVVITYDTGELVKKRFARAYACWF